MRVRPNLRSRLSNARHRHRARSFPCAHYGANFNVASFYPHAHPHANANSHSYPYFYPNSNADSNAYP